MKIRLQRELVAQREELDRMKRQRTSGDVEDSDEIEHVLAVRDFHEYELTDEHLRVAQISLVPHVHLYHYFIFSFTVTTLPAGLDGI